MKKVFVSICSLVLFLFFFGQRTFADNHNVSLQDAEKVAANYLNYSPKEARLVYSIANPVTGATALYFFNFDDKAFAIVSGCEAATPIVGYSEEGALDVEHLPSNMLVWVEGYAEMVIAAQNQEVEPTDEVLSEWKRLLSDGSDVRSEEPKASIKLMTEKWGQGDNDRPTYNLYCPVLQNNKYCVVGCVATSMSQVIHYWHFPKVGQGQKGYREKYIDENGNISQRPAVQIHFDETFYDYDQMPSDKLTSSSDSATIKAAALLSFHTGVAVSANYGVDGTSAYSESVPGAMRQYFKYKLGTLTYRASYSSTRWMEILRDEIDHHRPIMYSASSPTGGGQDAAGHAFICHGYRSNSNYFAFNWGWDGSADGWFDMSTVNGLTPQSYNFSQRQDAILGVEPPDDSNIYVGIRQVEPVQAEVFAAYPNPATYSVTVPYHMNSDKDADLMVYDVTGKLVETVRLTSGSSKVEINVTAYPKGIYVYRVKGGTSNKFIVQ